VCNAVVPGGVGDTGFMNGVDPVIFQSDSSMITTPYQACMPAEIANAVLFLVTCPAVNRAELPVDHGWTVA
jgi:NAD(P)-dependent dehydrogenase (short-subunit alcohol dehydrogenase family)